MAEECPSCDKEFRYLLQCNDCSREFCDKCTDSKFFLIPIQASKYDPGPGFSSICPECRSGDYTVISDDTGDSDSDREPAREESDSSDQEDLREALSNLADELESSSSESSYSSSDYSGSWSGGSSSAQSKENSDTGFLSWYFVIFILSLIVHDLTAEQKPPAHTEYAISPRVIPTPPETYPTDKSPETKKSIPPLPDANRSETPDQKTPPTTETPQPPAQENALSANIKYCGMQGPWVLEEFCRSPELASLIDEVRRLWYILALANGGGDMFELMNWQTYVEQTCRVHESPQDCLQSELEVRSQWLQAVIQTVLASPNYAPYKETARKLWKTHDW